MLSAHRMHSYRRFPSPYTGASRYQARFAFAARNRHITALPSHAISRWHDPGAPVAVLNLGGHSWTYACRSWTDRLTGCVGTDGTLALDFDAVVECPVRNGLPYSCAPGFLGSRQDGIILLHVERTSTHTQKSLKYFSVCAYSGLPPVTCACYSPQRSTRLFLRRSATYLPD